MGKPKKGKKGRQDDDFGDDDAVVVDPVAQAETNESEPVAQMHKAGKKGKKGKKGQKDWSDDEDVNSKFEALSLDQGSDAEKGEIEDVRPATAKSKKKDKKKRQKKSVSEEEEEEEEEDDELLTSPRGMVKPGMSAFTMLDVEDVSDQEEEEEEIEEVKPVQKKKQKKKQKPQGMEEEDENDEEIVKEEPFQAQQQQQQQQKKKGKKDKKKNEEEDIDAILADLEKPAAETEGKKKKKKKANEVVPIPEQQSATAFELVDIENMTQDQIAALLGGDDDEEDDRKKKKKEKKKKKKEKEGEGEEKEKEDEPQEGEETADAKGEAEGEGENEGGEEGSTVKTAAQKKKEKRERQKQQKLLEKQKQLKKQDGKAEEVPEKAPVEKEPQKEAESAEKKSDDEGEVDDEDDKKKKKRDRRKKKGEKVEEEEKTKKKPGNKTLRAMQEALQKLKEDEERALREEEERERKLEEARKAKEEEERLKKEKKEKEKQRKKEKIEQQKKEGTYKTKAQKDAEKRAREMLAARGLQLPQRPTTVEGETPKPRRIIYEKKRKNKFQKQGSEELKSPEEAPQSPVEETPTPTPTVEEKPIVEEVKKETPAEEEEDVLDSWELVEEKLKDEPEEKEAEGKREVSEEKEVEKEESEEESEEESSEEEEEEEESSSEEESSEESSSDDEDMTADERTFRKAEKRIQKRRALAESKRNKDVLRAPVVCVLGHVDTGKTKILDKLRRTNVQDGEAGGITQQIGATNVPLDAIKDKTSMCKEFTKKELKLPGLLIIDTPGHESFSNLRNRGSSLCDIAILVVDIMHGLEPQTIESINLLKARKTPFLVALNKIDRLFGWQPNPHSDIINTLKKQKTNTKLEFDERVQMVTGKFAEQGLNVALFYENKNPREYISMVPTSAHSGDGMGNLVALICELSQTFLAERIAFIDDLQATVMEVKALPGLGTTIDVIVVNGAIRESQSMIVAGTEGPIVTQIRGLLLPQPMKELRVKGAYIHTKEVKAAQGVKIIAKDLDKALAGLPLYVAKYDDEVAVYRAELEESLEEILKGIKVQQEGVFVQASTLGSLEALLEFLRTSKIPYAGINIGPVHKRDIMRASVMLERDSQYAVILAFDVKVERDAQEMADGLGVRIFTADIIYHLFDAFTDYRAQLKKQKQEEFKHIAVFPCKLRILPNCIFNARNPIVVGVNIEAGFVKDGTPVCVPSKEFLEVGRIVGIELNHKSVDIARKGQEVCIKIDSIPGEAPKLYGRHFDHTDLLVSKISRQSIDAVKNYFRDDMTKTDWQLMVELKKTFEIL